MTIRKIPNQGLSILNLNLRYQRVFSFIHQKTCHFAGSLSRFPSPSPSPFCSFSVPFLCWFHPGIQIYICSSHSESIASRIRIGRGVTNILFPALGIPQETLSSSLNFDLFSTSNCIGTATMSFHWERVADSLELHRLYLPFDPLEEARELKKDANSKWIGSAKSKMGYRPKYPIVIVPGQLFPINSLEGLVMYCE
jgi:hypothetical protein